MRWVSERLQKQCTLKEAEKATWAAADARGTAEAAKAGAAAREARATAGAAREELMRESTTAKLTPDEKMHLARLREKGRWSKDEELHLERLRADMLLHKLQQTEETLQPERALARRLFTLELEGNAATAAVPAANATLVAAPATPAASSGAAAPISEHTCWLCQQLIEGDVCALGCGKSVAGATGCAGRFCATCLPQIQAGIAAGKLRLCPSCRSFEPPKGPAGAGASLRLCHGFVASRTDNAFESIELPPLPPPRDESAGEAQRLQGEDDAQMAARLQEVEQVAWVREQREAHRRRFEESDARETAQEQERLRAQRAARGAEGGSSTAVVRLQREADVSALRGGAVGEPATGVDDELARALDEELTSSADESVEEKGDVDQLHKLLRGSEGPSELASLLQLACACAETGAGRVERVQLLLDKGADPSAVGDNGSALWLAVEKAPSAIVPRCSRRRRRSSASRRRARCARGAPRRRARCARRRARAWSLTRRSGWSGHALLRRAARRGSWLARGAAAAERRRGGAHTRAPC